MDSDHEGNRQRDSDQDREVAEKMRNSSSPRGGGAIEVPPPPPLRECNICGKKFTNGKALGGHRRSHFQALKKNNRPSSQQQQKNKVPKPNYPNNRASYEDFDDSYGTGSGNSKNRTCFVCEKEFPTKNALFGHMRSHPRDWRGVCPPNPQTRYNPKHSSTTSEEEEEEEDNLDGRDHWRVRVKGLPAVDLTKFTSPSWRMKDIRGRKCIGNYEAAKNLMHFSSDLSSCKKRESSSAAETSTMKKKVKLFIRSSIDFGKGTDDHGEYSGGSSRLNHNKGMLSEPDHVVERISVKSEASPVKLLKQDYDDGGDFDERKLKSFNRDYDDDHQNYQKSKSIQCLRDSSASEIEGQKYKCGTCGKSFATFQGLGGHRSIHKQKNKVTVDEEMQSANDEGEEDNSSSFEEEEEASQSTGPKRFDIDLNEPYFED